MQIDESTLVTIGHVADFAGIISFWISVVTLCLAGSIRKAMLEKIERKLFQDNAERQINLLASYRKMLSKDPEILNDKFYTWVHDALIEIMDDYRNILPREIKRKIKGLNKKVTHYLNDPDAKNEKNFNAECKDLLHAIISALRKERGIQ